MSTEILLPKLQRGHVVFTVFQSVSAPYMMFQRGKKLVNIPYCIFPCWSRKLSKMRDMMSQTIMRSFKIVGFKPILMQDQKLHGLLCLNCFLAFL